MSSARRVDIDGHDAYGDDIVRLDPTGTHALLPWTEYETMLAVIEAVLRLRDFPGAPDRATNIRRALTAWEKHHER